MDTRLDKWLWAARFFKTRQLAQQAINGGKVRLNQQPVKPGRKVKAGDQLTIRRGEIEQVVAIISCSNRRGPATLAATLYSETAESRTKREALALRNADQANPEQQRRGRPSKRDRRQLQRLLS